MKKFIIMSFVFVMLLSMSAMASETRVKTMGDNNNILLDDANIWMYPSRILDHTNIVVAELGYYNDEFDVMGINWKLDDNSALGTYFSTKDSWDRINLFYAKDMNGNKLGVHLNAQQWSDKSENDTIFAGNNNAEMGESFYDLTVGLTEANGQWDVALNFGVGSYTDINDTGFTANEGDGISKIGFYGRYFKTRNPNYTTIYHVGIMSEKYGEKNNLSNTSFSDKTVSLDVGCGINYTPSSHVLAVFDFGIMYSKTTEEQTGSSDRDTKNFMLPYFKLGMDGKVFNWLDLRFGATSYWNNTKREFESQSYSTKDATNMTYLGLGFNWGHLHVDTEADPELFLDGPNFLSGQNNRMYWKMSVTYDM